MGLVSVGRVPGTFRTTLIPGARLRHAPRDLKTKSALDSVGAMAAGEVCNPVRDHQRSTRAVPLQLVDLGLEHLQLHELAASGQASGWRLGAKGLEGSGNARP